MRGCGVDLSIQPTSYFTLPVIWYVCLVLWHCPRPYNFDHVDCPGGTLRARYVSRSLLRFVVDMG